MLMSSYVASKSISLAALIPCKNLRRTPCYFGGKAIWSHELHAFGIGTTFLLPACFWLCLCNATSRLFVVINPLEA